MVDYLIIAIDFGTAYSGYAYTIFPPEAKSDPILKKWGRELGLETPKTPTCILFDENEEFIKFGYEAQTAYMEEGEEKAKKLLFFENFKMALYGKILRRNFMITAANGKTMKAQKVFAESLRFLKDDALKTINENAAGFELLASDFTWVLTVPAIWNPSAKQFMREASIEAGIVTEEDEDKLLICLEPEAASVWCKKLPAEGFITQDHDKRTLDESSGTRYIVVDCGGGTIDITVYKVLNTGALKELHKASGNDQGGQNVDRKYKELLREIFCDGVWDEYEAKYPGAVQRMMYDFTRHKQVDDDFQITCPFNLGAIAQKKKEIEKFFTTIKGVNWNDGYIKISRDKLRSLFDESLCGITQSLKEIFKKVSLIDYILLVGGYANSLILRKHIIDQFGNRCRVLCPLKPQEAIVNGAVQFGRNPEMVTSRKSAYTYGVYEHVDFEKFVHKNEKKEIIDGWEYCTDVFKKLVIEGEDMGFNETREYTFWPLRAIQKEACLKFYRSKRKLSKYIDDWGVEEVGIIRVDMPDTTGGLNRQVKLEIKFGDSEMYVTATDVSSGSTASIAIDFIKKSGKIPESNQRAVLRSIDFWITNNRAWLSEVGVRSSPPDYTLYY